MVGVIVSFEYEGDFDRERVVGIAEHAQTSFEGMPELRSKLFTVDEDRKRATNVYVWESEAAARAFFSERAHRTHHGPVRRSPSDRVRADRRAGRQLGLGRQLTGADQRRAAFILR